MLEEVNSPVMLIIWRDVFKIANKDNLINSCFRLKRGCVAFVHNNISDADGYEVIHRGKKYSVPRSAQEKWPNG